MTKKKRSPKAKPVDAMLVPLDSIRPWDKNPRKNEKAVAKVAASIKEFGWVRPIIVNQHPKANGEIIVGHTARLAAISLGLDQVPVRFVNMEPTKARAAGLADNKLGEISGWDMEGLSDLLSSGGIDRELFTFAGFTGGELDRLDALNNGGEDAGASEPPAKPVTKTGDLWLLGRHRLVCGDSTNAADVALALGGAEPYLMVTDPPYGVEYDASWREGACGDRFHRQGGRKAIRAKGKVLNDDRADWTAAWQLSPAAVCYVWHAPGSLSGVVQASLEACGFELKPQIIWSKRDAPMGRGSYHVQHEPCWLGVRKGKSSKFVGGRKQTTVWNIDRVSMPGAARTEAQTGHSTQKPVECMARPIRNHEGDVYEPFCGSGTTIVAAEKLDRTCYALEISPAYCDVIVARWEALTGGKAKKAKR